LSNAARVEEVVERLLNFTAFSVVEVKDESDELQVWSTSLLLVLTNLIKKFVPGCVMSNFPNAPKNLISMPTATCH
jgi:hypothetical protein